MIVFKSGNFPKLGLYTFSLNRFAVFSAPKCPNLLCVLYNIILRYFNGATILFLNSPYFILSLTLSFFINNPSSFISIFSTTFVKLSLYLIAISVASSPFINFFITLHNSSLFCKSLIISILSSGVSPSFISSISISISCLGLLDRIIGTDLFTTCNLPLVLCLCGSKYSLTGLFIPSHALQHL